MYCLGCKIIKSLESNSGFLEAL